MSIKLHLRDSDDIEDALKLIEISYEIEFGKYDFQNVKTFGELTDKIISKIKLKETTDNTDEQGFYKLKESVGKIRNNENLEIESDTKLTDIFPRTNRRKDILKVEKMLDIKLKAFESTRFSLIINLILFFISSFIFFIDWKLGIVAVVFSFISFWTVDKTTKKFKDKTFGELTERMTLYNYIKSRQNQTTVNKSEIENKIKKLFADYLGYKDNDITRETRVF